MCLRACLLWRPASMCRAAPWRGGFSKPLTAQKDGLNTGGTPRSLNWSISLSLMCIYIYIYIYIYTYTNGGFLKCGIPKSSWVSILSPLICVQTINTTSFFVGVTVCFFFVQPHVAGGCLVARGERWWGNHFSWSPRRSPEVGPRREVFTSNWVPTGKLEKYLPKRTSTNCTC